MLRLKKLCSRQRATWKDFVGEITYNTPSIIWKKFKATEGKNHEEIHYIYIYNDCDI
jgi:hypothetical protein